MWITMPDVVEDAGSFEVDHRSAFMEALWW